jgi:hypothetical protein
VAKKAKRFGSRAKGNAYERHICNLANPYLECLDQKWSRTARSGGWIEASRYKHLRGLRADITVDEECPLFVECKNRKNHSLDDILKLGIRNWEPYRWWREAKSKAKHAGKTPILIFTKNFQPDQVLMKLKDYMEVTGVRPDRALYLERGMVVALFSEFIEAFMHHQLARKK